MMASADLNMISRLLLASLSPDEATRKEAETQLRTAAVSKGFVSLLLTIVVGDSQSSPEMQGMHQAAAIYFKNSIFRRYDMIVDEDETEREQRSPLDEEERVFLKGRILGALIACSPQCRPQLIAALGRMIRADCPKRWPELVGDLDQRLRAVASLPPTDFSTIQQQLAILLAAKEFLGWHGGLSSSDGSKDHAHSCLFPSILHILQGNVEAFSMNNINDSLNNARLELAKAALKCFFTAIKYSFSPALLMNTESLTAWMTLVAGVVSAIPDPSWNLSEDEVEASVWWKGKKWAIRIQHKILARYGCSKLDSYSNGDHPMFSKMYMAQIALPVLGIVLEQVRQYAGNTNLCIPTIYFVLLCEFLESATRSRRLWDAINLHYSMIIEQFILPRIQFNDADAELWEDDVKEYIRNRLDPFDDYGTVTGASISLVLDMCRCRKKITFLPTLNLLMSRLSNNQATDEASQRSKDGALFMLGSLASIISKTPQTRGQVDGLVNSILLPILADSSSLPFLRMRVLWALDRFNGVHFHQQTVFSLLNLVVPLLTAPEQSLPVRFAAASALSSLLDQDVAPGALSTANAIPTIMESLLFLANAVQLDSISYVMERMVETFSTQLSPYAVQLCTSLRDCLASQLSTYKNIMAGDDGFADDCNNNDGFGKETDRLMAAVAMLETIRTLVEAMGEKNVQVIAEMEIVIAPLIQSMLERRLSDLYDEVFELLDSITFSRKEIGPSLWPILPHIKAVFDEDGINYLNEMASTLDNFISYGFEQLAADPNLLGGILGIINNVLSDSESYDEDERIPALKLAESLLLNGFRAQFIGLRPLISGLLDQVLPLLCSGRCELSSMDVSLSCAVAHQQLVLNALNYDPVGTLSHLEARNATGPIFTLISTYAGSKYTRVHDKRLLIVAFSRVFTLGQHELPQLVRENVVSCMAILLSTIASLPKAIEERRRLKEEAECADDDDEEEYYDDDDYNELEDEIEEEASESKKKIKESAIGVFNDEDDTLDSQDENDEAYDEQLEEELYFETPLDTADIEGEVRNVMGTLARSNPEAFNDLASGKYLSPALLAVMHSLVA